MLKEVTTKKVHRFPTRAELEELKRARALNESNTKPMSPEPNLNSGSIDGNRLVRGEGIGKIWSRKKGKFKVVLSHKDSDLFLVSTRETLDEVFAGNSKALAEYWLKVRPMGGRIFIDDEGHASTYQGADLIYLGNIQHIFSPKK